jgi:hypothetical protein
VELLGWEGEDLSSKKDKGILRYVIDKGEGYNTPNDGTVMDSKYFCDILFRLIGMC